MNKPIIFTPHIFHERGCDDTLNTETSPGLYAGADDNRYLVYYNSYGRRVVVLRHKTIPSFTAFHLDEGPQDKVTRCGDGAIALSNHGDPSYQEASLGELYVTESRVSMMVHSPAHKLYMPEMMDGETEADIIDLGYFRTWAFITDSGDQFFGRSG